MNNQLIHRGMVLMLEGVRRSVDTDTIFTWLERDWSECDLADYYKDVDDLYERGDLELGMQIGVNYTIDAMREIIREEKQGEHE